MTQIQTLPAPLTIGFVEGVAVPKTIDSGAATPWAQAVAVNVALMAVERR